jgi:predicted transcriptional regulator
LLLAENAILWIMKVNNGKHTRVSKIKNEIQRIDWKIIERLVRLLYYQSKLKKTHISTKCNLSYDKCCRYLDWMEVMDLIKKENNEDGFEVVILTERGSVLYNKKFRDMKKELSYI